MSSHRYLNNFISLETLNNHDQIHNDIKPQNYLVKFFNDGNCLDKGPSRSIESCCSWISKLFKPKSSQSQNPASDHALENIEIVLTDFGLAGSDSKGGTPIFASPECLADAERKDKSSDIFSLGRVFLFMILPKEKFLEFLFVPLVKGGKAKITGMIEKEPFFCLIAKMMQIKKRINLETIRTELKSIVQMKNESTVSKISDEISNSTSENTNQYMNMLEHFS